MRRLRSSALRARRPSEERVFLALVEDLVTPIFLTAGFTRVPGAGLCWGGPAQAPLTSTGKVFRLRLPGRRAKREPIAQAIYEGTPDAALARIPHLLEGVERGEAIEAWVSFYGGTGRVEASVGARSVLAGSPYEHVIGDPDRPLEERMAALAEALRDLLGAE